jgi:F-type H+-transporting ATPase subunit delta
MKARPDKVAKRYGSVLFELAQGSNELKAILKDQSRLRQCIDLEPREWGQVVSPSLPLYTQRRIIDSLLKDLKLGTLMTHFVRVLCENRRLPHLKGILDEFLVCTQRAEGIVEGILETAIALSPAEIEALQKSLTSQLGKSIHLQEEIKESLLGGVILRMGSLMIDGSMRTQLNKLKTVMKG